MTKWRYQMGIDEFMSTPESDAYDGPDFEKTRDAIVAKIKVAPDFATDVDLQSIVDDLADASDSPSFNGALQDLYDWADEKKVWVG